MNGFRAKSSLSSARQSGQSGQSGQQGTLSLVSRWRASPLLGLHTSVFALLSMAACSSSENTADDRDLGLINEPPTNIIPFQDAIVAGNDTTIDLDGVFDNGGGNLTLTASLGTIGADGLLTIADSVFTEGTHSITVTAIDADGVTITETVELVSDKTPTIATGLPDAFAVSNTPVIDLNGVFAGGSGVVTFTASVGSIGTDGKFTLGDIELSESTDTITFTAIDADGDAVEATVELISDKTLIVANRLQDATVAGNDTIIDLANVFDNGSDTFTLATTFGDLGADNKLTLIDSVFTDGIHTITITATDAAGNTAEETVVLVSDKTPTVATTIADASVEGNGGTTINLAGVFDNGSGNLTLTASAGKVGSNNILTLNGSDIANGVNTLIVTATDADGDAAQQTLKITANKFPTVASALADVSIVGNGGTTIDLAGVFDNSVGALTFAASAGKIGSDNRLTLVGTELMSGANTITVTATDGDGDAITDVFEISTTKTFASIDLAITTVFGARQHSMQTFDVGDFFITTPNTTFTTASLPGISLNDSIISFDNAVLVENNTITITASDSGDTLVHSFTYALYTIKDRIDNSSSFVRYIGTNLPDMITGNTTEANGSFSGVHFIGDVGDDIINSNIITASDAVRTVTFDGEAGDDMINDNSLTGTLIDLVKFAGGEGVDTISGNTLAAGNISSVTFDGGAGVDTISGNTLTGTAINEVAFAGGVGVDTISGNTLSASDGVFSITFDGGDGNDTISDNHVESTGTDTGNDITEVTFMGGAGNDVFRENTVIQANDAPALLTFDGGDGEDTVVFRLTAGEYAGISDWIVASDGGVTTITLTGDGAAVTLIDVETISFADGAGYSAADAGVEGNGGVLYDLANAFAGTFTAYSADKGIIGDDKTLTLAGTELAHGANAIVLTATAGDGTKTTEMITVNAVKTLRINGAKQHDAQTLDLSDILVTNSTTDYTALNLPSGIALVSGTLTFTNSALAANDHTIAVTATDGDNAFTHTLTYALDAIKDQQADSNTTYTGTTLADAITGNAFAETSGSLINVYLDGGDNDDTISSNTLSGDVRTITFEGGAGNDTISDNTISGSGDVQTITFDGGAGNDTISSNTISASGEVFSITFDGGAGNDTISDNHFESTGNGVHDVTLIGGAGDDVFRNNTATQANGASASVTIDGGVGEDTVEFRSIGGEYAGISDWLNSSDGGVTTITLVGDGAVVTLINVETISFADGMSYSAADAGVEGNGGVSYDLANAFSGTFTAYSAASGTVTGSTLNLAGSELGHGVNTVAVTATTSDGTKTTETIIVNVVKNLRINGATQHDEQAFDLGDVFVETATTAYTATGLPAGVTISDGNLAFTNSSIDTKDHSINVTATDGEDVVILTLIYALNTIQNQTGVGSGTTYTGTTLDDAITGNAFAETSGSLINVYLDGGAGNDTISDNTLTAANGGVRTITFHGGDGDDTISNNALSGGNGVNAVIFFGGAGDDVFRDNTVSQNNGSALLTIDGGVGEDTVAFRLDADKYAGISDWIGGVTSITLSGDGAVVSLINVETISFADGSSYNAADAGVEGDGGVSYDLAKAFSGTFTAYSAASGTVTGNTLTLAGTELGHGVNTVLVTATAGDTETTETITVNALKTLQINGLKQHTSQTIDLADIFVTNATYANPSLPNGVALESGKLTFTNADLGLGDNTIPITVTDGGDMFTYTLTYDLDAIKDQTISDGGSNTTYTGITLDDAITGNQFAETSGSLSNVYLAGGGGNDSISSNNLSTTNNNIGSKLVSFITFDGGDGIDTINSNTLTAVNNLSLIRFDGGADNDTISSNSLQSTLFIFTITFNGGDGDDTITSNSLSANSVEKITFDGGAGDDTISNNTLTATNSFISKITFDGGAGANTISNNTLTANTVINTITFAGGEGVDTINSNTISASGSIWDITFDGGDSNDFISGNHFASTGSVASSYVRVTLMGGEGNDVFSGNTATQVVDHAALTIDGGAGTDQVRFALGKDMFDITGAYGSNITVTDKAARTKTPDGVDSYAEYVLIDVEELFFADAAYVFP